MVMDTQTRLPEGFRGERAIVTPYNVRSYQAENAVTRRMYLTHIGHYPDAQGHFRERPSGAAQHIFIYCDKGHGWIRHGGQQYPLEEDCFYIIPAGEAHSYGASPRDAWSIYWLHFDGEDAREFRPVMGRPVRLGRSDASRRQDRLRLFDEMYQNLAMGYNPSNLEYISYCLRYFLASLKYVEQYREIRKVREEDVVRKVIRSMKDNLENRITLDELARSAGYSATRLTSLFKQRTSFSPMEYYNQLKIQRACTYLQFSDLKIKEIAFRLNYYDPFHFSKAFRREMEISPKEYRSRYRLRTGTPDTF